MATASEQVVHQTSDFEAQEHQAPHLTLVVGQTSLRDVVTSRDGAGVPERDVRDDLERGLERPARRRGLTILKGDVWQGAFRQLTDPDGNVFINS
jgi:hypothetical protein